MPPRVQILAGLKPTSPFTRFISSTAQRQNSTPASPRGRENTASSLLNLDRSPRRPANAPQPNRPRTSTDEIQRLIARTDERFSRMRNQRAEVQKRAEAQRVSEEYMMQMPRRWREGDIFTPHDLTPNEMRKWRKKVGRTEDVFDVVGINPLDHYRNFSLISDFMTAMGHIQHSNQTGLRPPNQRKIAKTIRRVMGMGIHPSVHRHPELLQLEWQARRSRA
ncbi:hypothetical protein VUR80DRAFT_361 [Thermomyces stellatus]